MTHIEFFVFAVAFLVAIVSAMKYGYRIGHRDGKAATRALDCNFSQLPTTEVRTTGRVGTYLVFSPQSDGTALLNSYKSPRDVAAVLQPTDIAFACPELEVIDCRNNP